MTSIRPSLPGDAYGVRVPPGAEDKARLFTSRLQLLRHCRTLLPHSPTVVEVGVFQGFFTQVLLDELRPTSCHLIDTFHVGDHVHGMFSAEDHLGFVQRKFAHRSEVRVHQGLSWEKLETLENNSCDFIYIDADHSYEAVTKDIEVATRKLRCGGILQFNDYCAYSTYERAEYGVLHAVNEFLESSHVKLVGLSLDRAGYHDLAVQVFKPPVKVTLVTPCSRPENLPVVAASIDFTKVHTWFIVHDARPGFGGSPHRVFDSQKHPNIVELWCDVPGLVGHPARNLVLDQVSEGFVYFVDDDNIVHPKFWDLVDTFEPNKVYSFDMDYNTNGKSVMTGDTPLVEKIDTAQVCFDARLVGSLRFPTDKYEGDGLFFSELINSHRDAWVYVPGIHAFYNKLRSTRST